MINAITCSVLGSTSTSVYDEMYNCISKSTLLEPKIKQLMKKKDFPIGQHTIW